MISEPLIISAFVAGLLTFFAPCTLPLVPGYLAFLAGVSDSDVGLSSSRRKIIIQGLFFVLGFSFIFIFFGMLAGLVGGSLAPYRVTLSQIGGIVVLIFGLFFLGVGRIPLFSFERRMSVPRLFKRGTPANSFLFGASFGLGWTPCIGPILGTILTLALVKSTAISGAFLLAIFSMGLSLPFMTVAFAMGHKNISLEIPQWFSRVLSTIGGVFLVLIGTLLITDNFGLLSEYFLRIFSFIDYDWLLSKT